MRLALVTNNAAGVFQSSVIAGAREIADRDGLGLDVLELADGATAPAVLRAAVGAAGALVLADVLGHDALTALAESRIPVTLVSHDIAQPGASGDWPGPDLPVVMHDNRQGMGQLLEHVIADCGRSRPLFIRGEATQLDSREREQAFREGLMRHGLPIDERAFLDGAFIPERAAAALAAHLQEDADFDAVVAADYLMALAVLPVLGQHGLRVPGDVCVVGFGDGVEAREHGLTTVAADVVELGRRGARQLVAQLPGGTPGRPIRGRTLLSTELVLRDTCGGGTTAIGTALT